MNFNGKAKIQLIIRKNHIAKNPISMGQVKHYMKVKSYATVFNLTHLSLKIVSDERPV